MGHVQKRLGTALRNLKKKAMKGKKLPDGKGIGGAVRLTDKVIDSLQNWYGRAIRSNKGDLQGMKMLFGLHGSIRDRLTRSRNTICARSEKNLGADSRKLKPQGL